MKIGIISSSGGSVFAEVLKIVNSYSESYKFYVITDRECSIENICYSHNIECLRILDNDNKSFSNLSKEKFDKFGGVDFIILFFLRLVSRELFSYYPTFNLHPSLLPAFRGFNPIKQAIKERVRFLGATLHLVNESIDGGPIVAQSCIPITEYNEETLNKISFIQKVYLFLLLIELMENHIIEIKNNSIEFIKGFSYTNCFNPSIKNSIFLEQFALLQQKENIKGRFR